MPSHSSVFPDGLWNFSDKGALQRGKHCRRQDRGKPQILLYSETKCNDIKHSKALLYPDVFKLLDRSFENGTSLEEGIFSHTA